MTASQIVNRLEALGVRLWAENGTVCYKDEYRVMTPEVLQSLQKGKSAVLKVLEGKSEPWGGPRSAMVGDPLTSLADACELETKLFEVMPYEVGSGRCGDWITQSEVTRRMGKGKEVIEPLLLALEAAGRVTAHRAYLSETLWRIVPPCGLHERITPSRGYRAPQGEDFTAWEDAA